MDVEFILYIGLMLCAAFLIAAVVPFLYFEIVFRLPKNVSNPIVRGLVIGVVWGIVFMAFTAHQSSSVGTAMAGPLIILGFPMVGAVIGVLYERKMKPLVGGKARQKT